MNRRHHLQTLVSLGLTAPFGQCRILADTPKPDRVKFNTVDGVTLEGNFYPGSLGKKGDTFLFLHQLKTGFSSQDGWANLAVALQEKGHSVLTFDFRGHGESRSVAPEFWSLTDDPLTGMPGNPHNRVLNPSNLASRRATSINAATFPAKYFFTLVNDIAAAKMYLDERNDKGECNSSSLYVVAEGDACPLASLWMASEFSRKRVEIATSGPMLQVGNVFRNPRIIQNERITKTNPPEGNDLLAGIWLSYKPGILGQTVPSDRWPCSCTVPKIPKRKTTPAACWLASAPATTRKKPPGRETRHPPRPRNPLPRPSQTSFTPWGCRCLIATSLAAKCCDRNSPPRRVFATMLPSSMRHASLPTRLFKGPTAPGQ